MATVVVNTPDHIEFKNVSAAKNQTEAPTVSLQAGDWDAGEFTESGIIIDVYGAQLPLLSSADARKLAKWLTKAADMLDGCKPEKKRKNRYQEDDDDNNVY